MLDFLNAIVGGILLGGIYSLVALGIVIIYKSSKILSFTQGGFLVMGAITGWAMLGPFGLHPFIGITLALAICTFFGYIVNRLALRPIIGEPLMTSILITIALSWLFDSLSIIAIGGKQRAFPIQISNSQLNIAGINLSVTMLLCFLIAFALFIFFILFYRYHRVGLAMRGTAEDHEVMQNLGIRVKNMLDYSWMIAALCGGVSGILLASIISVNINLSSIGLTALVVVLVAGLESIPGVLIVGPMIGILENLAVYLDPYVGGGSREVIPFIILLIILLIKPYGLFGLKRIERI